MNLLLGIAVFFIIWWVVLFAVLPFGVVTQGEVNEVVPGTPESAPAETRMLRVFLITTAVSCVVFGGVYWIVESPLAKTWIDSFFDITFGTKIFDMK